ncbi:MAG: N-acetylglucosamine-6-phosphate deacetylase [Acutalibacteraceae bacterium]|nr:N-acetylglucosamine-6-phosphate deacetylase [Acutalibacteraceae bacterium]
MILKNGKCFVNGQFIKTDIKVENGKIIEISDGLTDDETVDCTNSVVIPGYVDIHTHGCNGIDFSTASSTEIISALNCYLENGTTSLLATTVSMYKEDLDSAVDNINSVQNKSGAQILGINLEGPFLSKNKLGSHDINTVCNPNIDFVKDLKNITEVCLAPELEGADEFIQSFDGLCSVAHTQCDYDTALNAFNKGANHITHLFNAMNGLNHRNPGVVGAFCDSNAVAELICDGVHVNESVLRMMFNLAADRIAIISDSMAACGMKDGNYKLGSLDVTVKNAVATLQDGTLAGSTTFVGEMVRRLISFGIEKEKVILSATKIPADSIGAYNKGRLKVGCDADILICDDDFNIKKVYKS